MSVCDSFLAVSKKVVGILQRLYRFRTGRSLCAKNDLFKPAFGGFELLFAMGLQRLAALIKGDRIFEIDFALLKTGNDAFEFFQRGLETERLHRDRLLRLVRR